MWRCLLPDHGANTAGRPIPHWPATWPTHLLPRGHRHHHRRPIQHHRSTCHQAHPPTATWQPLPPTSAACPPLPLTGSSHLPKSKLTEAVLEGGVPFNKVYGMNAFEYPSVDQRFNEVFNKAMLSQSTYTIKNILTKCKAFEQIQQLVDVGGGLGHTLRVITSKYPLIKGINFDLPHVVEHAPSIPGVEHIGGDMFESVPKGDAIFMKWILHDWSDEKCLRLLKNCYKALPDNGKVIIVEVIMPDEPETSAYARLINQMDVLMMTQNPGGKERTRKEFEALAKAAGFAMFKHNCCVSGFWVMEFFK